MTFAARFDRWARVASGAAGSWWAFALAALLVAAWCLGGIWFGFGDTYQLIINTGTTIVTFLVVFAIQHTQTVNDAAMHLKLDELIRAIDQARNAFMAIETQTEEEIEETRQRVRSPRDS